MSSPTEKGMYATFDLMIRHILTTSCYTIANPNIVFAPTMLPRDDTPRPACGTRTTTHSYNTPLHVFALFLILTLSTLACSFPLLARRYPSLPIPSQTLFISRHFGTGVLIATAFVHLLPTAYGNLTDPCLPRFWNEVYPAMAGFISMCSVLVVVGVEMVFAMKGARHEHGVDLGGLRGNARNQGRGGYAQTSQGEESRAGYGEYTPSRGSSAGGYMDSPFEAESIRNKPLPPEPPSADSDSDLDLDELEEDDHRPLNGHMTFKTLHTNDHHHANDRRNSNGRSRRPPHSRATSHTPPDPLSERRQILQCLLLEAGILFHSVFIGMALSVSTGPPFYVLLIAISFHQTFEGLALGSRIAAISSFSTSSLKPWIMCLLYGVTTPIGQAVGLGVHGLYDPSSEVGLLMVGVVNAVSCGLLVYAGLVQLLAEDFLSERSYVELKGKRRVQACGAVVGGAMLMAFVGAFA
ncbi:hypothetical protein B0A48_13775 [Cryoendolithus antarcticus]|uniref:Zinc-regulated transporter 2 n=1 Tax=Cryoendolithus antarcticus TaxID=1507870 RepID=A0A1V8SMN0_9PEZI|nr:hypothetical protein B0A48_13775 [Cryoendolithus antarcticus]